MTRRWLLIGLAICLAVGAIGAGSGYAVSQRVLKPRVGDFVLPAKSRWGCKVNSFRTRGTYLTCVDLAVPERRATQVVLEQRFALVESASGRILYKRRLR